MSYIPWNSFGSNLSQAGVVPETDKQKWSICVLLLYTVDVSHFKNILYSS